MKKIWVTGLFIVLSTLAWAGELSLRPVLTAPLTSGTTILTGVLPTEGQTLSATPAGITFQKAESLVLPVQDKPKNIVMACYLEAPRFQTAKFKVKEGVKVHIFMDDSPVKPDTETQFETGGHKIIIFLDHDGKAELTDPVTIDGLEATISLKPDRPFSHLDYTRLQAPTYLTATHDGKWIAVSMSTRDTKGDPKKSLWVVQADTEHAVPFTVDKARNPVFSNTGDTLYYTVGKSIEKLDLRTMARTTIHEFDKPLSQLSISSDDQSIYFILTDTFKKDKKGDYELLTKMAHKRPDWKSESFLFSLSTDGHVLRKILGPTSITAYAIRQNRAIVSETIPADQYPWSTFKIAECNLTTLETQVIGSYSRSFDQLVFLDDTTIVFASQLKPYREGQIANYYDRALFSLDLPTGQIQCLSPQAKFTPGIDIIYTRQTSNVLQVADGKLMFIATEDGKGQVYVYEKGAFDKVNMPDGMISGFFPTSQGNLFITSSFDHYPALYRGTQKILDFQTDELSSYVSLSPFKAFSFKSKSGYTLHNYLIYPANFVPGKTYPLIMFYYGGVIPCGPVFHPTFQWLSGNGYFVLLTTPRGAVGRGEKFADEHANEWGEKSAADLIEAATYTVKHEPSVDASRMGAYSGSYGGFLAMSLATKTTVFKALISEYGISNITSYWGAGYWGYEYGMSALAGSFPWNAKDVFVDKSPLFHADKIQTPLLLMHGDADTNVPVVESDQMFTALKVLGKQTAYVRFFGENHGMKGKFSNWLAQEEFVMAWFDRYLKNQPERWNFLAKQTLPEPEHKPLNDYFFYGETSHE